MKYLFYGNNTLALTCNEIDQIDKLLFLEKQKIYMDSSIHTTSFEVAITMKIYEFIEKGVPLELYTKQVCYDKQTLWIHTLVKYILRDDF